MRTLTRVALAAAALTVACGQQQHGSAGRLGQEPLVSPPVDLAGVVHRVHLPYTEDADGFAGGHTTYAVAAARDGAFVVTPNAAAAAGAEEVAGGPVAAASAAPVSARFETVAIARGGDTVVSGAGTALLADDGSLLVARGEVLERLVNGGEGIEQSWAFPAPPAGGGEVTVRIAVNGLVPAGETAGGVHFNDGTTGAGLRYGHATWIDALGSATEIPARLEGTEIVLAVPEGVVEGSLYPAILDPVISPEIALDQPVSAAPYSFVRTVTDGSTSLVLWLEGTAPNCRVLGLRIGPAGEVLDPAPTVIGTDAGGPLVAEYGDGIYLVAWRTPSYYTAYARVSAATGAVLDPVAQVITGASQAGSIAFDGSSFVAVLRTGSQYTAFQIFSSGAIGATLPVATMSPPASSGSTVISTTTVSCARRHCLAAWNETLGATCSTLGCTGGTRQLRGALIDPNWWSASTFTIATSGTAASTRPMSAANEDGFFVVWSDDSAGENDIYGSWIPFDGLRSQNRVPISTAVGPQRFPLVEHSGGRFVVLWRDGRNAVNDIYGARVTAGGTVLDPDGVLVTPSTQSFGLTPAPGGVLATWADVFGVHGRPLADGGASGLHAIREVTVPGAALPSVPVATFTGGEYLLTWTEGSVVYATRVDMAGEPTGDPPATWAFPLAEIQGHAKRSNQGNVLLVAWDGSTIIGQLLGTYGWPMSDPFVIASGVSLHGTPRVGVSGTDYLVMWTDNAAPRAIRAVRYAEDGTPVDPAPFVLAGADGVDAQNPVPSSVTGGWVVAYARGAPTFSATGSSDVYAIRVPARGTPGTPQPLVTAAGDQLFPSIQQRDSSAPLLVWQDLRDPAGTHLRFARLLPDCSGLDGPERVLTPPLGSISTVYATSRFDGVNTVVIWSRSSSGLHAARIDASDAVLEPSGVAIEPSGVTVGNGQRSVESDRAGRILLSYRNAAGEVRTRLFEDASGSADTTPLEPGTPFVVAGTKANDESVPKVASDGTSFFVVWRDTRGYPDASGVQGQVYGMRVSATGAPLDATAVALSPESSVARNPGVTFDGTSYIVGWFDTSTGTYYARRVSPVGLVLDPVPLVLATGISPYSGYSILLHMGPTGHLLTWTQSAPSADLVTARAQWVGRNLVTLGAPFDIAPAPSFGGNAAAFLGGRWLVSYVAGAEVGSRDVYARWVGEDGTPGTSFPIAGGAGDQAAPMVAEDGRQFVVFYQDRLQVPAGQYHAARVATSGGVVDVPGKRLFPTDFNQSHVHASWDGREWYVTWYEDRTGTGGGMAHIYGARMTADLVVRDAGGIALTGAPVPVAVRNQATNGAGVILLAYQRKDASLGDVNRAVARVVTTWVPLALSATGTGTGRVLLSTGGECRGACTSAFAPGARVTFTPSADGGSVFSGWSGACSGTGSCTLTLASPAQVTARFDLPDQAPTYALDLQTAGTAAGGILLDPLPGATGYAAGTVVAATAQPVTDAKFSGWMGACQGLGGCIVVMDGPKSLAALFDAGAATATAQPVTVFPATASVEGGALLTITGDRFAPGTIVTIGSASAPVQTIQASNRLTAFSPTVPSPGPADVRIVNPDGSVLTLPSGFTFYVPGTNTPPGEDVTVAADRTYTYAPETSLKFEGIVSAGATTVSAPFVAPPDPPNFAVLGGTKGPKYLEISTSATFTGKIEIAIKYNPLALGLTPEQEARMRLLHYVCSPGGQCAWEDATEVANPHDPPYTDAHPQYYGRFSPPFVNPDTKNHVIYGVTTSLSPFALADGGGTTRKIIAKVWGDGSGWISGPGIDCGADRAYCIASVGISDPPQSLKLAAQPATGSLFKGWAGACGGSEDCTVTMNVDRAVLAWFVPARYPVAVQTWGAGTGKVEGPGGISCQTGSSVGCSALFDNTAPPQMVTLTATALGESRFAGWALPCVSTTNTCTIEVRSATSVAARFEPTGHPVTVQAYGGGNGTVTGGGLSCRTGSTAGCSIVVPNETPAREVTLTATPDADSVFVRWGGVCQGTSASCRVAVAGPAAVAAMFAPRTHALTVSPTGPGTGRVSGDGLDCGTGPVGTCVVNVPNETPARRVALTATPSPGSVFAYWSGACTGSGACEVTMDRATSVSARFEPDHFPLSVQLWGSGSGTVTGPGIDCSRAAGATCQTSVANTRPGTKVMLTASEAPGSVFAGWSQPCVVDGKTCTVEMTDARTVAATFALPLSSP